jgi:hypothetical protein
MLIPGDCGIYKSTKTCINDFANVFTALGTVGFVMDFIGVFIVGVVTHFKLPHFVGWSILSVGSLIMWIAILINVINVPTQYTIPKNKQKAV